MIKKYIENLYGGSSIYDDLIKEIQSGMNEIYIRKDLKDDQKETKIILLLCSKYDDFKKINKFKYPQINKNAFYKILSFRFPNAP